MTPQQLAAYFHCINTRTIALMVSPTPRFYAWSDGERGPRTMHPLRSQAVFDLRRHSLMRGNLLVLTSLLVAVWLADFPNNRATLLLVVPLFSGLAGMVETARCMRKRWDFYHGGVILCLYMDLMVLAMMTFLLLYPYWH